MRVLVNQSRNSSGEVQGQAIGVEYHRLRAFEQYLNGHARDGQEINLKIIPKAKDQLLGALARGEGDLVAPGSCSMSKAAHKISTSEPDCQRCAVVAGGRQGRAAVSPSLEQLSGAHLALTTGSAAADAISQVNQKLALHKQPPIKVEWVDPTLAVEDVLEMVQAGIFHLTIVEKPIAERWAKILPKLRFDKQVVISEPGDEYGSCVRTRRCCGPALIDFSRPISTPSDQDAAFQRIYRRLYQVRNPLARVERQRLEKLRPVLQKHAREQGMDWLNLAALAFKESALDPGARNSGGPTGLMQITPSAAQRVGVNNIESLDSNVQAGARYLAMIRCKFFASPKLNERERMAFVLGGLQHGPGAGAGMRTEARAPGAEPEPVVLPG